MKVTDYGGLRLAGCPHAAFEGIFKTRSQTLADYPPLFKKQENLFSL